ncbi:TlpA family protein disulfide reductase [Dactylosporangium sp. CS-047395]|uniref:TlpA family protein disulfide reductase n=1 Tax=Dactylosporangium sp. CS-047395 TaxID=3239936 RepID=UPI003D92ED6B
MAVLLAACAAEVKPSAPDAAATSGPRCIEKLAGSGGTEGTKAGPALPAMALPCFSGGRFTDVADLGGVPTVVNLWASWCEPCREELPVLQQLAAGGKVRVVGVVTKDRHDQAQSVIDDKKLTFPMLEDQGQQFAIAASPLVSRSLVALPATLFVTAEGRIAYAYQGKPLTTDKVRELTQQYLGVSA